MPPHVLSFMSILAYSDFFQGHSVSHNISFSYIDIHIMYFPFTPISPKLKISTYGGTVQ